MDQSYHCDECDVGSPDTRLAIEHRNGTGHSLTVITDVK